MNRILQRLINVCMFVDGVFCSSADKLAKCLHRRRNVSIAKAIVAVGKKTMARDESKLTDPRVNVGANWRAQA